jgi:hypothetical protein
MLAEVRRAVAEDFAVGVGVAIAVALLLAVG